LFLYEFTRIEKELHSGRIKSEVYFNIPFIAYYKQKERKRITIYKNKSLSLETSLSLCNKETVSAVAKIENDESIKLGPQLEEKPLIS